MTHAVPVDRINGYLRQLTPQERSRLLVEMERLQLCGEAIEGTEPVLKALRAEFRDSGETAERIGNPSRYFFEPLQPVLVDRSAERTNSGEISRGSLAVIWEWINQFLLPTMAREYCSKSSHLIATNDLREARRIANAFQSKVVKCLEGMLVNADGVEQARLSFAKCTSSRASFDDLTKMVSVLRATEALTAFDNAVPARIEKFEGDALAKVRRALDALCKKHADGLPFALTMLSKHLAASWQLIRLATKMAASKDAGAIATTPYALAVTMALDHLDERRMALRQALQSGRVPTAKEILIDIYDIEYSLRVRIDGLEHSAWGRRLDEMMRAVAADLDKETHNLPDNLQHVLESPELHTHDTFIGRLTYLAWKGHDVLAAQPAYWKKILNLGT